VQREPEKVSNLSNVNGVVDFQMNLVTQVHNRRMGSKLKDVDVKNALGTNPHSPIHKTMI